MLKRTVSFTISVALLLTITACTIQAVPAEDLGAAASEAMDSESSAAIDLDAVKSYALENAAQMQVATAALADVSQRYYDLVMEAAKADGDPYARIWDENQEEVHALVVGARDLWLEASTFYELDEGIVAGVPSLVHFDVWIDAGPPGSEDPEEALQWQLELPDGRVLESPGNFFHNLLEPTLWGTIPEFTGLKVDLDGDGSIAVGEALPEANMLLGATQGLDDATLEMQAAIEAWDPTLEDALTALVTMIPTMNEYFEQWKESVFVSGSASEAESFIAVSRLLDIKGILAGLSFTYDNIAVLVSDSDSQLDQQIRTDFDTLIAYVNDLYAQEQSGVQFSPEEADLFGTEAQDLATALAALVAQAASDLNVTLDLA
ncbi:MAG: hypothetical protein OXF62_00860 [Caldilineaceae bacterium]|nr:hypothetical protein [Caldilineaceae bacterium]